VPSQRPADTRSNLPLSEVVWEVLLALAEEDRHGYAILLAVEQRTGGRLQLLPGTLYRALHRLQEQGWVVEVPGAPAAAADPRRRVFHLTAAGRRVATAEARRLDDAVRAARAARLLTGEEGA
jgi:DNA-binding PadR family transcriptional regulator